MAHFPAENSIKFFSSENRVSAISPSKLQKVTISSLLFILHFPVMERREARLNALHMRTKTLREIQKEPSDAWLKRKRERDEKRKQMRTSSSEDAWRKAGPSIGVAESSAIHNSIPKNRTEAEEVHVDVHEEEDEHINVEEHEFDEEPGVEIYYDDSGPILDVEHEEEVIAEDAPQSYRRSVVDERGVVQRPLVSYGRLATTSNRMAPHRQYYISQVQQPRPTTSYSYQPKRRIVYIQKPVQ